MDPRLAWVMPGAASFALVLWGFGDARAQQPPAPDEPSPPAVSIVTPSAQPSEVEPEPTNTVTPTNEAAVIEAPKAAAAPAKVQPPPGPPKPIRSPVAILRVLDKVTAETMRFEAPVGRRVRYKTLIFTVKVCETRNVGDAQPRPSAYLVIDSQPGAPPGRPAPPAKEVFRGWVFANRPGLNPFEHPVYDAWLDVCTDAPAPA